MLAFNSVNAGAQANISTKKMRMSDFPNSITKIVLSGNDMTDAIIKESASAIWRVSPFEFCSMSEYQSLQEDSAYYFLVHTVTEEKKYDGLLLLTLQRGGRKDASEFNDRPFEVISIPIASKAFPSGREMIFMPAFLGIIQDYALKAMDNDKQGYAGLGQYNRRLHSTGYKTLNISRDDLVPEINPDFLLKHKDSDTRICSESEADSLFLAGAFNNLVSYVVTPFDPHNGSYCYKMLFDTDTRDLVYYSSHRITGRRWGGLLPKDIKRITYPRKQYR